MVGHNLIIGSFFVSIVIASYNKRSTFFFSAKQLLLLIKAMQNRTLAELISNKRNTTAPVLY